MNRVFIKTYGCQMNERDSEAVASKLRIRGYSIVDDDKNADIVLLNTCSVRDQSEQKAIGKAGYLSSRKKGNPNFVLGVMGCMAQNYGENLLEKLPDLCAAPLGCIVGEPSGLVPVLAHKGKAALRLSAAGVAGHSSRPDLGSNAIHALVPALAEDALVVVERDRRDALPEHPLRAVTSYRYGDTAVDLLSRA